MLSEIRHKTHDFKERLAFSHAQADLPMWEQIYRKAFASFASMQDIRADGWAQRGGIDRIVILHSGKVLNIDEKVREKDYPDFCLEYYSNEQCKIKGWVAKDLACDYIAYAFLPSRRCYLLPFQELRRAWSKNNKAWGGEYKKIEARNNGYITASLAVPIDVVLDSIASCMVIRWHHENKIIINHEKL